MQNKKTTTIIAGVILIAIFVGLAGYFYLKAKPPAEQQPTSSPEDLALLSSIINKEGTTSLDMIDQAIADKKISEETGLVYKTYAIFGDMDNLPGEFVSDKVFFTANYELQNIREKFETLSPDAQAKIAPFLKRPDDPESYWNVKYGQDMPEAETVGGIIPVAHAVRANAYTEFFTSADGKIKIWYPKTDTNSRDALGAGNVPINAAAAKTMAQKIKNYLDSNGIIAQYDELMKRQLMDDGTRGGDGKLDIYVAPGGNNLGICFAEHGLPSPSHIIINNSISNDMILRTVLAHELFHSYQYLYKHDWRRDNWYGEATAVWSEDFIYPADNSEHPRVPGFIPFPEVTVYKESPPDLHHYSAYLFPWFLTDQFGDDLMRTSWEACERGPCIDGIDGLIDGGLNEQWKKFTLWNYNKDPAQFYMDIGPFPLDSSEQGAKTETIFMTTDDTQIDIDTIKPLAADISYIANEIQDEKIKKVTFKDFKNFTDKTDDAAIKAVIYYKNGKNAIEDWTELKERSFCLENPDENIDHVVLIFSNAQIKKDITETKIKAVGKPSCYEIKQEDQAQATIHFPYSNQGAYNIVNINTSVDVKSDGEPIEAAKDDQEFAYQTKWRLYYEFEQIKDAFTISCGDSTADFGPGWTTRSAGYLDFDLNTDELQEGDTFPIDMTFGLPHPNGNYEDAPFVAVNCAGAYIGPSKIDLSMVKGTYKNIYTGKIMDMTEDGAKIEIANSCLYDGCTMQDGSPFQTMDKIILQIKKPNN